MKIFSSPHTLNSLFTLNFANIFGFLVFLCFFVSCQMGFSVLSPFSIYSVKWGFQFYPLSASSVTILAKTRRRVFAGQKEKRVFTISNV